jgi:hypothetical protein
MRKITNDVVTAFMNGDNFNMANSRTDGHTLWLHDNAIAWRDGRDVVLTMAGWGSVTTRERLNGLLDVIAPHLAIVQRNHDQYVYNYELDELTPLDTEERFTIEGK